MFASRLFPLSILVLASAGCAAMQDAEFAVCNWASAEKTWLECTTSSERWSISSDYRKGWKEGYRAQLNGTGCYGPPGPPPCYWSPKYRTCEGKAAVEQWFAGWHAGVSAAVDKGDYRIPLGSDPPRLLHSNRSSCAVQEGCNGSAACYQTLQGFQGQQDNLVSPQRFDAPPPFEIVPGMDQTPAMGIAPATQPNIQPNIQPNPNIQANPIKPVENQPISPSDTPGTNTQPQPNVLPNTLPEDVQPAAPLSLEDMPGLIGPVGSIFAEIPVYTAQFTLPGAASNP